MPSFNLPPNLNSKNPLIHSPLKQDFNEVVVSPGESKFIVTETVFFKITTESGTALTTED